MMATKKIPISRQYLREDEISVTILDVKNPSHFVVRETPAHAIVEGSTTSSEVKNFIVAEQMMQKYYQSIEPTFFQLPVKGSKVVIFQDGKFYRAQVQSILTLSEGHLIKVYLLDYGVECTVPRNCLYEIHPDFFKHPFQVLEFKLLGLEPISFIFNPESIKVEYGSVDAWDPSAMLFIEKLQKELIAAHIVVKGFLENCLVGTLYMTFKDGIKCINDELTLWKYAQFNSDCWNKIIKLEDILQSSSMTGNNLNSGSSTPSLGSRPSTPEEKAAMKSVNCMEKSLTLHAGKSSNHASVFSTLQSSNTHTDPNELKQSIRIQGISNLTSNNIEKKNLANGEEKSICDNHGAKVQTQLQKLIKYKSPRSSTQSLSSDMESPSPPRPLFKNAKCYNPTVSPPLSTSSKMSCDDALSVHPKNGYKESQISVTEILNKVPFGITSAFSQELNNNKISPESEKLSNSIETRYAEACTDCKENSGSNSVSTPCKDQQNTEPKFHEDRQAALQKSPPNSSTETFQLIKNLFLKRSNSTKSQGQDFVSETHERNLQVNILDSKKKEVRSDLPIANGEVSVAGPKSDVIPECLENVNKNTSVLDHSNDNVESVCNKTSPQKLLDTKFNVIKNLYKKLSLPACESKIQNPANPVETNKYMDISESNENSTVLPVANTESAKSPLKNLSQPETTQNVGLDQLENLKESILKEDEEDSDDLLQCALKPNKSDENSPISSRLGVIHQVSLNA